MLCPLLFLSALLPLAASHGYLCTPEPRGLKEHEQSEIDLLKSPNTRGICRGETTPSPIFNVSPGGTITLDFKITAPHTGPCEVYLLDTDLQNPRKIADKYDCAAPGKVGPWTITLPSDCSGRQVLRWYWEGRHIRTPGEPYEQCIDLMFGSGGSLAGDQEADGQPQMPSNNQDQPDQGSQSSYGDDQESQSSYGDDQGSQSSYGDEQDQGSYSGDQQPDGQNDSSGPDNECDAGSYKCCSRTKFQQCSNGQWSPEMQCSVGTRCLPNGNAISCGV